MAVLCLSVCLSVGSNDGPSAWLGVTSWAACCSGPSLQCQLVRSEVRQLANGETVSVTCPASDVMTGCNAMAPNGGSAGAQIRGELQLLLDLLLLLSLLLLFFFLFVCLFLSVF